MRSVLRLGFLSPALGRLPVVSWEPGYLADSSRTVQTEWLNLN